MGISIRNSRDFAYAVFLVAIGAGGLWFGENLAFGSPASFGPGFVPKILSALMIVFGIIIGIRAIAIPGPSFAGFAWRQAGAVVLGIAFFGTIVTSAGLVPATALTTLVLLAAERGRPRPVEAVVFAIGSATFVGLLFGLGLGVTIPMFPW